MKVKVLNDVTLVLKKGQTVDIDDAQYQLVSRFVKKIDDEVVETDEETTENEVLDEVVETDASVEKNDKKNKSKK